MTKQTLEKLAAEIPQAKTFFDNRKAVYQKTDKKDDVRGEIRGYLAGLRTMGAISDTEFRVLFSYYTI